MKSILLLDCLLVCSLCIKITQVSLGTRTSLPTTNFENKYFYLTRNEYSRYSSYIYFYFEDNNFGLNYNNLTYCGTNSDPYNNPEDIVSYCSFSPISYYGSKSSFGTNKYFYKISINTYYSYYYIVYYEGTYPSGYLNVTSSYNDLWLKMTAVFINSKISLPTTGSENKYFFLTNDEYNPPSVYLYFYLEDNNFGLNYNNIKYCRTDINPNDLPEYAVSDCSLEKRLNYSSQYSSETNKYFYSISTSTFKHYTIVYYEGRSMFGALYIRSSYNDLTQDVKMTPVSRNSRISLPTTISFDKYFYIKNIEYYPYSSYLYFYLEYHQMSLSDKVIKYCYTNIDPYYYPNKAVSDCSLNTIDFYDDKVDSDTNFYYYKFSPKINYTYSIVYYEEYSSSGSIYVYCDHKSSSSKDYPNVLSAGAIAGIVIGSIIFIVIFIIILAFCCASCRRKKIAFIPVTQPNYVALNSYASPSNQPNIFNTNNNPNIPS